MSDIRGALQRASRHAHTRISDFDQDEIVYRTGIEFVERSDHDAEAMADFADELAKRVVS